MRIYGHKEKREERRDKIPPGQATKRKVLRVLLVYFKGESRRGWEFVAVRRKDKKGETRSRQGRLLRAKLFVSNSCKYVAILSMGCRLIYNCPKRALHEAERGCLLSG